MAKESTGAAFDAALCTTLLEPSTVAAFKEKGLVVSDNSFKDGVLQDSAGHEKESLGRFLGYEGGVVCRWGAKGGDSAVLFAYGDLSDEQAEAERANIAEQGSKPVEAAYERYTEPSGYDGGYAFGDGHWAYVLDNGVKDVLEEIVKNAPEF